MLKEILKEKDDHENITDDREQAIIQLNQVSVVYRRYANPTDALWEFVIRRPRHQAFYALDHISFAIKKGESLGIIGDNGAGKSTLLKVLAGYLPIKSESEKNQRIVQGKVSAILELGGGFHPEFTGRENAKLGLALMGVEAQHYPFYLEKVIAFAELGDFFDKAVKSYSSGMLVRLAFSVAIVVEPDILIVDEALSVGDQYFQKKSLDRMRDILNKGTTLIFCSHNLYQIKMLCDKALWLEKGTIKDYGEVNGVVDAYQDANRARHQPINKVPSLLNNESISYKSNAHATPILMSVDLNQLEFITGDLFRVNTLIEPYAYAIDDIHIGIVIRRNDDVQCYGISSLHDQYPLNRLNNNQVGVSFVIDTLPLLSGDYCLEVWLIDQSGVHVYDSQERCCAFSVRQKTQDQGIGITQLAHRWESLC
ncbi:MAG: ABC transporter ATP-binding protein [bacterium]